MFQWFWLLYLNNMITHLLLSADGLLKLVQIIGILHIKHLVLLDGEILIVRVGRCIRVWGTSCRVNVLSLVLVQGWNSRLKLSILDHLYCSWIQFIVSWLISHCLVLVRYIVRSNDIILNWSNWLNGWCWLHTLQTNLIYFFHETIKLFDILNVVIILDNVIIGIEDALILDWWLIRNGI
jgi:hypothetical protein